MVTVAVVVTFVGVSSVVVVDHGQNIQVNEHMYTK